MTGQQTRWVCLDAPEPTWGK